MPSRIRLTSASETANSIGRSGDMNRFAMLRDHISSRNDAENPIWARNIMSHSNIEPISVPPAIIRPRAGAAPPPAAPAIDWPMKLCRNPQVSSCTIGQ